MQKFVHELLITNQVMYLNPPVEQVRVNVLGELSSWQDNILTLPRVTPHDIRQVVDILFEQSNSSTS